MHYADLIEEIIHAVTSKRILKMILWTVSQCCPSSQWLESNLVQDLGESWNSDSRSVLQFTWWHIYESISFYEQHRSPTPVIATPSAKLAVNPWKRFLPLYSYSQKHTYTSQALLHCHFAPCISREQKWEIKRKANNRSLNLQISQKKREETSENYIIRF